MSLTRAEYIEIVQRLKKIQSISLKVWKKKHYKWANDINWEVLKIKEKIESIIGPVS